MGKLILVLIAVICLLDVGFNAVMSIDRHAEVASTSITEVLDLKFPVVNSVSELVLESPSTEDTILVESDDPEQRPVYVAAAAKTRRHRAEANRTAPAFTPGTTVITIPTPETYSFKSATGTEYPRHDAEKVEAIRRNEIYNQATAANIQRSEKASSVAGAVRKPWDWIKAVGDKLR
jgi:hypothetical protein